MNTAPPRPYLCKDIKCSGELIRLSYDEIAILKFMATDGKHRLDMSLIYFFMAIEGLITNGLLKVVSRKPDGKYRCSIDWAMTDKGREACEGIATPTFMEKT